MITIRFILETCLDKRLRNHEIGLKMGFVVSEAKSWKLETRCLAFENQQV